VRNQDIASLLERWGSGSTEVNAAALFTLRDSLQKELDSRSLTKLFVELEIPIANLLARLESSGICVDQKELTKLRDFFEGEVARESKAAHEAAGHEFNVASPKQLQVVLFDELRRLKLASPPMPNPLNGSLRKQSTHFCSHSFEFVKPINLRQPLKDF
jgi:DNA polymerase-1